MADQHDRDFTDALRDTLGAIGDRATPAPDIDDLSTSELTIASLRSSQRRWKVTAAAAAVVALAFGGLWIAQRSTNDTVTITPPATTPTDRPEPTSPATTAPTATTTPTTTTPATSVASPVVSSPPSTATPTTGPPPSSTPATSVPPDQDVEADLASIAEGLRSQGWTQTAPSSLSPRTFAAQVAIGDEFLVTGGESHYCVWPGVESGEEGYDAYDQCREQTVAYSDGAIYAPATDSWREIAAAPYPPSSTPPVVLNGVVYLTGLDSEQHVLLAYDIDADTWRSADLPTPFPVLFRFNDRLFAADLHREQNPTVYELNVDSFTWTTEPDHSMGYQVINSGTQGPVMMNESATTEGAGFIETSRGVVRSGTLQFSLGGWAAYPSGDGLVRGEAWLRAVEPRAHSAAAAETVIGSGGNGIFGSSDGGINWQPTIHTDPAIGPVFAAGDLLITQEWLEWGYADGEQPVLIGSRTEPFEEWTPPAPVEYGTLEYYLGDAGTIDGTPYMVVVERNLSYGADAYENVLVVNLETMEFSRVAVEFAAWEAGINQVLIGADSIHIKFSAMEGPAEVTTITPDGAPIDWLRFPTSGGFLAANDGVVGMATLETTHDFTSTLRFVPLDPDAAAIEQWTVNDYGASALSFCSDPTFDGEVLRCIRDGSAWSYDVNSGEWHDYSTDGQQIRWVR